MSAPSASFSDYGEIPASEIRHTLDDNWSTFHFGQRQFRVHRGDIEQIRERRAWANVLSAQAAMWETELGALEAALDEDAELDAKVRRVAELADAQRDPEEEGEL